MGRPYIAFSYDQGTTWTRVTQLSLEPNSEYTSVCEVKPGRLLVVYDKFPPDDSAAPPPPGGYVRSIMARFIDVHKD